MTCSCERLDTSAMFENVWSTFHLSFVLRVVECTSFGTSGLRRHRIGAGSACSPCGLASFRQFEVSFAYAVGGRASSVPGRVGATRDSLSDGCEKERARHPSLNDRLPAMCDCTWS